MSNLTASQHIYVSELITILKPHILDGFYTMLSESRRLCIQENQEDKQYMTFQNFMSKVPSWSKEIIDAEVKRIQDVSNCSYLENLLTGVHIVQLKALTCVRVGSLQKKIDINIPSLSNFIHKIYINSSRKLYTNIDLFEQDIPDLEKHKNRRTLENIIQLSILDSIRESIPIEQILRTYVDSTMEEEIDEECNDEEVPPPSSDPPPNSPVHKEEPQSISFNNVDSLVDESGKEEIKDAPKDIQSLETLSIVKQQKQSEELLNEKNILNYDTDDTDDDGEPEKLVIGNPISPENNNLPEVDLSLKKETINELDNTNLPEVDILTKLETKPKHDQDLMLNNIEVLETEQNDTPNLLANVEVLS